MLVRIREHEFRYPDSPQDLLLGEWVDFVREHGKALDQRAEELDQMPPGRRQLMEAMRLYADRAYAVAAWFAAMDIEEAQQAFTLQEVTSLHRNQLGACFQPEPRGIIEWGGEQLQLPEPTLHQGSAMTFGEIVDSKAMIQNAEQLGWGRWELVQRICAIFLRPPGAPYQEQYGYLEPPRTAGEEPTRSEAMAELPIGMAMMVSEWFEELNQFLEAFTIFQESSMKSGNFMRKHLAHWGWVNFLKAIAKTKVFDIPGSGLNSVQCARQSKAFDVLMFASEEKEYSEALSADQEEASKRK